MERVESLRRPGRSTLLGLGLIAAFVATVLVLMGVGTYQSWGPLLLVPILVVLSLPALARQANREGDRTLLRLLILALVLKLAGAVVRHYVAFDVYGGVADASGYHGQGVLLAEGFAHGDFHTGLESFTGTDLISFLTGVVYTVIGPSSLGGFLFYSWLGFWGLFLFYRAFVIAVPEGSRRSYARLLFFLPSLMFWPSSIGKEAWMMLSLGLAAFGAARVLTGRFRGLLVAGVGLWLAALVRPHVAGMLGLSLAVAYVLRRPNARLRHVAPIGKLLALGAVALVAAVLVSRTDRFLRSSNIETGGGVQNVLTQVTERTREGKAKFAPSILESPGRAPVAAVTVLFRPLLFDAHNAQSAAAAVEGTFLLLLSVVRVPWALAALRSARRQPFVALAVAYTVLFVIGFSAMANFGIIARQRVQVLPFYLILLCIPRRRAEVSASD